MNHVNVEYMKAYQRLAPRMGLTQNWLYDPTVWAGYRQQAGLRVPAATLRTVPVFHLLWHIKQCYPLRTFPLRMEIPAMQSREHHCRLCTVTRQYALLVSWIRRGSIHPANQCSLLHNSALFED